MTNTLKKITRDFAALPHERVVTSEGQQRGVKRRKREEKVMASNTLVKRESERRGFGKLTSRGETTTSEANNIQDPVVRSTIISVSIIILSFGQFLVGSRGWFFLVW